MEGVIVSEFNENSKKTINFDKLIYKFPVESNNGHYSLIYQEINGEEKKILINTPFLKVYDNIFTRDRHAYIELELTKENKDFFTFISELEDHNLNVIYKKSSSWFGNQIPLDVLDDFYNPFIKFGREGVAKIRILIPLKDDKPTIRNIEKGDRISIRMEYKGIKFLRQQFSSVWLVNGIKKEDSEYEFGDNDLYDNSDILKSFIDIYKNKVDTPPKKTTIKIKKKETVEVSETCVEGNEDITEVDLVEPIDNDISNQDVGLCVKDNIDPTLPKINEEEKEIVKQKVKTKLKRKKKKKLIFGNKERSW